MPIAVVATAVSSVVGGIAQASAAKKAAKAQVQAGDRAIASQREMFDVTRGDLSPFRAGGQEDFEAYNKLAPFGFNPTMAELESTPGYQFAKTQGLKAVQNSATARGLGVSGAAQKGAAAFATGLADQTYGQQFQRSLQTYQTNANRLLAGANIGADAAARTGQFATATGQGIAATQIGQGQAVASGQLGVGNAISNIGSGVTNALMLPAFASMYSKGDPSKLLAGA